MFNQYIRGGDQSKKKKVQILFSFDIQFYFFGKEGVHLISIKINTMGLVNKS